jgi:phosphoglycerate kinase
MACTFYRALGESTGTSLVEDEQVATARGLLESAQGRRADLRLPIDLVVAERVDADAPTQVVAWKAIPDGWMVVDAGPDTVGRIAADCDGAGTIIWNGPLGIYEIPAFAAGTRDVARAVAASKATTVIGGGDLAAAVEDAGVADKIGFISTGGGATIEFLEGRTLPGVAALRDREVARR